MSSVSSAFNSNGLNFSGLASGIDSTKILEGLTAINQRRVQQLTARKDTVTLKQTTFASLQAKVLDFQSQLSKLGRSVAGAFDTRKTTSTDETLVTAAAGTSATPGTHTVTVMAVAQPQIVSSGGFADPAAAIREGTLSFRVGGGATTTVTVGPTNNTLSGLADAINASGGEVTASVVNDGTATPYRLVLRANRTGAANALTVTNNLTTGPGAAINPTATTVQAAADTQVRLGSGGGALTVRSPTTTVSELLPGVTLNVVRADTTKPVTINVAADTEAASKSVQDVVAAYNAVIDFIDERDNFNPATGSAGTLLGSREAADLQNDMAAALMSAVPGLKTTANRLSNVGVTLTDKGRLQLDQGKLDRVLAGQETGVSLADVKRLFALTGEANTSGVRFVVGSDKTKPTPAGQPYRVNVTAPATRGAATGATTLPGTISVNNTNNTFSLTVNGVASGPLTLAAGSYTPATLAAAVQAVVNSDPPLQGNQVSVDISSGKLRITSAKYGSASTVKIGTGTAVGAGRPLGFAGTENGAGTDVVGSFTVNGKTEAATGTGQLLAGSGGNANTDGLQVQVTAAGPVTADLSVTQGVASRLGGVLNKYLDPVNGRFKTLDNEFAATADGIAQAVTRQNAVAEAKKESLLRQFTAMESAVSKLKTLGTQLSAIPVFRAS